MRIDDIGLLCERQVPVPMEIPVVQTVEREVVREVPVEKIVWRDREVPVGVYMDTVHMCACIFAQASVFCTNVCAKGRSAPYTPPRRKYRTSLPFTSLYFPSLPFASLDFTSTCVDRGKCHITSVCARVYACMLFICRTTYHQRGAVCRGAYRGKVH
jgi:hypothetical protein